MLTLEVCVADVESLLAAEVVAATTTDIRLRLEVCAALEVGGLTPTLAMLDPPLHNSGPPRALPRHVLIRPRPGDFCYTQLEQRQMQRDIHHLYTHLHQQPYFGGFVVGCLTSDYNVDVQMMSSMLQQFHDVPFTFHRAIDQCRDILQATKQLIQLHLQHANLKYILTSGGCENAEQGADVIRQMQHLCASTPKCSLQVMAAAGINERNIASVIDKTCVQYVHGSFRERRSVKTIESLAPLLNQQYLTPMLALQSQLSSSQQAQAVKMGAADSADRLVTSVDKLQAVLTATRKAGNARRSDIG